MLNPAQCPEHALMARIPLGLGPSLHQLRSRSLCLVRRLHSYYGLVRLPTPVHHRLRLLAFPMRTAVRESELPRMTALHMLRSTITTVSAPANSSFRGSITHPTQPLCTLRVRRYRRLTQHSLPGDLLGLTWAGLAPADRASFAGAFCYLITSSVATSSVGGTARSSIQA